MRFFLAADLITYDNDDSINNVNNNITLLKAISLPNDTEQVSIFWESSDIEVIKIQNNFGIVTLTDESQSVTLKATLLISDTVFKIREFNLTVKPKPLPLMHIVTLDLDGGMINGQIDLTYSIEHGNTMPVPSNPVKHEFIFIEWQLDGLKYNFDTPITSDITLIAVYEEKPLIEMVTVLFDIGDGSYGNREHVWPQSKLGSVKDDLHNLRAANSGVNSTRSNYPFVENGKPFTGSHEWQKIGSGFYPGDEHIGDVARIVLYVSIRYNLNLNLVGNLSMFLNWNELDPVNDFERERNDRIEGIQSNRNPFIDHPELVDLYFGQAPMNMSLSAIEIELDSFIVYNQTFDTRQQYSI